MSPFRALLALLVATALLAVGCGDDSEPASEGGEFSENSGGGDRVVVEGGNAFNARAVFDAAGPGVVTIRSIFESDLTDNPLGPGAQGGQGSGFVLNEEGEIATNAHVVTDAQATNTTGPISPADQVYVQFPDQNQVEAEIVGFDPFADVALLKVDPEGLSLEPLELCDTDDAQIGEPVAAIGSPFEQRQSLSSGIVSATDRSIPSLTRFSIDGAIQTDASINPGNSGGPLLDAKGCVIGLNQQIDTTSGGNQGVGFAVPIDLAERSIEQLRTDGKVEYSFLGVTTSPLYPQLAEELGVDAKRGAIILEMVPGSPAEDAGLRVGSERILFQGSRFFRDSDIIVEVEGEPIVGDSDLPKIVSLSEPGEELTLTVIRDGEREEITVTPAPRKISSGS